MHSLRDKVNTYHMPENVLGNILESLEACVTEDIALVLLQSQLAFLVQWFSTCGSLPLHDSDDLFMREVWQPLLWAFPALTKSSVSYWKLKLISLFKCLLTVPLVALPPCFHQSPINQVHSHCKRTSDLAIKFMSILLLCLNKAWVGFTLCYNMIA